MTGPIFNRLISSRLAEGVRKLYGEELSIDTVAPELVSGVTLEEDRPEMAAATGTFHFIGKFSEIARVGEFSAVEVYNPANSGILVVVKDWSCDVASMVVGLQNRPGVADVDATQPFNLIDGRAWPGAGVGVGPVLVRSRHNAAQQGSLIWDRHIGNSEHQTGQSEAWAVLFPDQSFTLWGATVNVAIFGVFRGYFRAFRPEELHP